MICSMDGRLNIDIVIWYLTATIYHCQFNYHGKCFSMWTMSNTSTTQWVIPPTIPCIMYERMGNAMEPNNIEKCLECVQIILTFLILTKDKMSLCYYHHIPLFIVNDKSMVIWLNFIQTTFFHHFPLCNKLF